MQASRFVPAPGYISGVSVNLLRVRIWCDNLLSNGGIFPCLRIRLCDLKGHLYFTTSKGKTHWPYGNKQVKILPIWQKKTLRITRLWHRRRFIINWIWIWAQLPPLFSFFTTICLSICSFNSANDLFFVSFNLVNKYCFFYLYLI